MANKDTSKQWFEEGDYPTQAQFAQVFDWIRWKDEKISADDLSDSVKTILANSLSASAILCEEITLFGDSQFMMLAKRKLVGVAIKNVTNQPMEIFFGTTENGSELGSIQIDSFAEVDFDLGRTFWQDTIIYVSGVDAEIKLLIDRK